MKDKYGKVIRVGSRVRVVSLDPNEFGHLEADELSQVMSMVGEVFEVYKVDHYHQAWVRKEWWVGDEEMLGHGVGLASSEAEIVN